MALTVATRVAVIIGRGHSRIGLAQPRDEAGRWRGRDPQLRREQWADAHETDRKKTLVKAMAAAFGTNPPPASPRLADDARQRALRWAPPGFEPARASAAESGHADIAPAAELPASMNG